MQIHIVEFPIDITGYAYQYISNLNTLNYSFAYCIAECVVIWFWFSWFIHNPHLSGLHIYIQQLFSSANKKTDIYDMYLYVHVCFPSSTSN